MTALKFFCMFICSKVLQSVSDFHHHFPNIQKLKFFLCLIMAVRDRISKCLDGALGNKYFKFLKQSGNTRRRLPMIPYSLWLPGWTILCCHVMVWGLTIFPILNISLPFAIYDLLSLVLVLFIEFTYMPKSYHCYPHSCLLHVFLTSRRVLSFHPVSPIFITAFAYNKHTSFYQQKHY